MLDLADITNAAYGHKVAISNPYVSEEAKEHSCQVLEKLEQMKSTGKSDTKSTSKSDTKSTGRLDYSSTGQSWRRSSGGLASHETEGKDITNV